MSHRLLRFLLIFVLTLAVACDHQLQAQTANSAYHYLASSADRARASIDSTQLLAEPKSSKHKSQLELGFLVSYETPASNHPFDVMMHNVAFTYDNAVSALAFIAAGDHQRAKQIVDTLVYAQNHDRFFHDGRVRNAYRGGRLVSPSGDVLLPGRYDDQAKRWVEQESQISTHTGNVAWAMLALLGYYETYGGNPYLVAAKKMGEWIEQNCHAANSGYIGGFSGWEPKPNPITYKSTEHNIDLYAAFKRLYLITGDRVWQERANYAKQFVQSMWDQTEGKFWTGTQADGETAYKNVVPLDVQAWAVLAFREEGKPYQQALKYAEKHHKVDQGFTFNHDGDGIWYEGTAQMAVAYQRTGQSQKSKTLISTLKAGQDKSGGLYTTNQAELRTGFIMPDGNPWNYYRRIHVGATAWMVLAEKGVNPFWLGK
ncbi:MAG: hypothetical protein JO235_20705 [Chroococcidiopsidaceae cyanobacterium CP_BM_RX_35]|nr:hypothetical protein [Chroococcidiopsidaceae cyanobacterium CP_BM_RX_35]